MHMRLLNPQLNTTLAECCCKLTCQVSKEGVLEQLQCSRSLLWVVCDAGCDQLPQAVTGNLGQRSRRDALRINTPNKTLLLKIKQKPDLNSFRVPHTSRVDAATENVVWRRLDGMEQVLHDAQNMDGPKQPTFDTLMKIAGMLLHSL